MKKLNLRTKTQRQYLEIPVDFIDEYIPQAPEGALKVYLYLVRCAMDPTILLSLSDMADLFDITQKTVVRALTYWEECGLLALEYEEEDLTDITLLPFPSEGAYPADSAPKAAEAEAVSRPVTPVNVQPLPVRSAAAPPEEMSPIDFADLERDENFSDLLDLAQYYLKKPANSTMRDALGYCYLLFDRQNDVIEYLLEYCIEQGHFSVHYIRKVAENWKSEGLSDLSSIKKSVAMRSKTVTSIQKAFGIRDRQLADVEMDYVTSWSRDFDLPIILEACNRTVKNAHSPSFNYANSILTEWKAQKVTSLDDVRKLDESHAKKEKKSASSDTAPRKQAAGSFRNFDERKDDYTDLIRNYYES